MTFIKNIRLAVALGALGFGAFWWITAPTTWDETALAGLTADPKAGALVFAASGCASCHSAQGAQGDAKLILSGGRAFASDFGTFYAPNISQSPLHGIGSWDFADLANAVTHGTTPDGKHLYPAFPYTTYNKMTAQDLSHLYAYLKTLPADETANIPHNVGFPFNIRRTLGGWKLLFANNDWALTGDLTPQEHRGRYLVEAMGHCAECHTPRNALGGLDRSRWLAGGPNPDGKGTIPNITPHADGIGGWADLDVVTYLNSGFTPDYDVAGGQMAEVIENTKLLPPSDLEAITAYLRKIAPLPTEPLPKAE